MASNQSLSSESGGTSGSAKREKKLSVTYTVSTSGRFSKPPISTLANSIMRWNLIDVSRISCERWVNATENWSSSRMPVGESVGT